MRVRGVSFANLASVAAMHSMVAIGASDRPGWTGVCLRPVGAFWRRVGHGSVVGGPERRVNAVCWHGHARFLRELFDRFPDATVETSFPVRASAFGDAYSYDRRVWRHRITVEKPAGSDGMGEPQLCGTIGYWGLADWLDYTRDADIGSTFYPYTPVDLCRHEPEDMERYQTRAGALRSAPGAGHE